MSTCLSVSPLIFIGKRNEKVRKTKQRLEGLYIFFTQALQGIRMDVSELERCRCVKSTRSRSCAKKCVEKRTQLKENFSRAVVWLRHADTITLKSTYYWTTWYFFHLYTRPHPEFTFPIWSCPKRAKRTEGGWWCSESICPTPARRKSKHDQQIRQNKFPLCQKHHQALKSYMTVAPILALL